MSDVKIRVTTRALMGIEEDLGEPFGAIAARWEAGRVSARDLAVFALHAADPKPADLDAAADLVDSVGFGGFLCLVADQLGGPEPGKPQPRRAKGG